MQGIHYFSPRTQLAGIRQSGYDFQVLGEGDETLASVNIQQHSPLFAHSLAAILFAFCLPTHVEIN